MNKGTLTILDDTHIVLAMPHMEAPYSPTALLSFDEIAMNWLRDGGCLAFPFPVEVIDMRTLKKNRLRRL